MSSLRNLEAIQQSVDAVFDQPDRVSRTVTGSAYKKEFSFPRFVHGPDRQLTDPAVTYISMLSEDISEL